MIQVLQSQKNESSLIQMINTNKSVKDQNLRKIHHKLS